MSGNLLGIYSTPGLLYRVVDNKFAVRLKAFVQVAELERKRKREREREREEREREN